jgi:hypothetical protein
MRKLRNTIVAEAFEAFRNRISAASLRHEIRRVFLTPEVLGFARPFHNSTLDRLQKTGDALGILPQEL